jgi:exopolysaccharide biosynthesis protein
MNGQLNGIVLTNQYLFRLDPDNKFKLKKENAVFSIKNILKISITHESHCQLVVIKTANNGTDFVFYLITSSSNEDRIPELLANIYRISIK